MPPSPLPENRPPRVLIIDDDVAMLQSVARVLRTEGFGEALLCADPLKAESFLDAHPIGAIILDLVMPHLSGEQLLNTIMRRRPDLPVIVVTATNAIDSAVRCIKAGAFDYIVKPIAFARLLTTVAQALRQHDLRAENLRLQEMIRDPRLRRPDCFTSILTDSPAMFALFRHIEAVAPSSEPVLIVGETGTGKELVARALHAASGRSGEILALNIAGIDDVAFADTLFGHVKGAFTGADHDRDGLIERAGNGTLFLDEIGDLGMDTQVKLLRLLQEGEFFPLGTDRPRKSRCRIIAATNRDLRTRMRENRFREDLYYRLHGHLLRLPPLRERIGDIPLLATHFITEAANALGKSAPSIPPELTVHLSAYAFPGNIRELRAMVVDAVARHDKGILSLTAFREHMDQAKGTTEKAAESIGSALGIASPDRPLPTLEQATHDLIAEALKRMQGNQGAAARLLGVSRRTISRFLNHPERNPRRENP